MKIYTFPGAPFAWAYCLLFTAVVAPRAEGATVAVMPVQGELTEALRQEVEQDLRSALRQRADVVATRAEVQRALEQRGGTIPSSLEDLGALARSLGVEFVLVAKVTPLPGQYRLELSAFRPTTPAIELLERVILESNATQEIRTLLDQLLSLTTPGSAEQRTTAEGDGATGVEGAAPTDTDTPTPEPTATAPGEDEMEPDRQPGDSGVLPPPQPGPARARPAYGARPLEFSLAMGPTALLQDAARGGKAGGRLTVGMGYSFYAPLGVGIRADFLSHFGNANAVGATIGSGVHYAPFRFPLFVGIRLGLGFMRATAGGQANFFVLRPETVVAYRIGQWVQLELRPAVFAFHFGKTTVVQYEALFAFTLMLGA
jgi:hypothetical protein